MYSLFCLISNLVYASRPGQLHTKHHPRYHATLTHHLTLQSWTGLHLWMQVTSGNSLYGTVYYTNLSCVHKYESTYSLKHNSTHISSLFHKIVLLTGHILNLNAIIYCIHNICFIYSRCTHHTISLHLLRTNSAIIC
jgi:hypothetical protein